MESFFIKSENEFWEKTEFFRELKQSAVNDDATKMQLKMQQKEN